MRIQLRIFKMDQVAAIFDHSQLQRRTPLFHLRTNLFIFRIIFTDQHHDG